MALDQSCELNPFWNNSEIAFQTDVHNSYISIGAFHTRETGNW